MKRRFFGRVWNVHLFNMEFLSSTRAEDEGSIVQTRFFKYAPMSVEELKKKCTGRALMMDRAIGEKKTADQAAFAVVGMTTGGQIHIAEIYMERGMSPKDKIDKYFELHFAFDCNRHGIETVAYQKALVHLAKEEMFRRGKTMGPAAYFEIEPVTHGNVSKDERIEGILGPRYAAGYITHDHVFI